ncbi:MAG: tRNA pseudouridine(38-40) synthase TruA [Planctomycetota bacterium]|jgi:tRNA pseudouridine38-40 synthase
MTKGPSDRASAQSSKPGAQSLKTFCIRIAYDGTRYAGWQRQSSAPSIQAELERAAEEVNGEPSAVLGAGRTDAGVHARDQAARFRTSRDLDERRVPRALNAHLPEDIVVHAAREVDEGFHPIGDATAKHYRYTLRIDPFDSPFDRAFVYRVPGHLDVEAMRAAAKELRGRHDFAGFEKSGSPRPSTIRTLRRVDVEKAGAYIGLEFEGDGFLYGMARNLAGTLLRIGRADLDPAVIPAALADCDPSISGPCLPARGLCLMRVDYPFARDGEYTA